jgi:hypothetical protein
LHAPSNQLISENQAQQSNDGDHRRGHRQRQPRFDSDSAPKNKKQQARWQWMHTICCSHYSSSFRILKVSSKLFSSSFSFIVINVGSVLVHSHRNKRVSLALMHIKSCAGRIRERRHLDLSFAGNARHFLNNGKVRANFISPLSLMQLFRSHCLIRTRKKRKLFASTQRPSRG